MKRIQQFLVLLTMLCGFSLFSAQAGYFSYVTSITPPETTYHFIMDYWNAKESNPNPCSTILPGGAACYIQINHLHSGTTIGGAADRAAWRCRTNIANLPNEKAVVDFLTTDCGLNLPLSGDSRHAGAITTNECIGFFLSTSPTGGSALLVPNGICGIAPPPTGKCAFISNQLDLSHGMLDRDEVEGHQARAQFTITCNQNMKVRVSSSMQDDLLNLRPDGSIRTALDINGESAPTGVIMDVPANDYIDVNVLSTLKTFGTPRVGNFSGTTTFVLSIP